LRRSSKVQLGRQHLLRVALQRQQMMQEVRLCMQCSCRSYGGLCK
jgi:hypothetical protein